MLSVLSTSQPAHSGVLFSFIPSLRRCSRQHRVRAGAAGSAHIDTGQHSATAAPVRTGNTGAGESVTVSHTSAPFYNELSSPHTS